MRLEQIIWAKEHDWFIRTIRDKYGEEIAVVVNDVTVDVNSGEVTSKEKTFYEFNGLYHWAGY